MTEAANDELSRLLSDASIPKNFVDAGAACARAFKAYLGENVLIVEDVHCELHRLAEGSAPLREFLKDWPALEPIVLPIPVKGLVADILNSNLGNLHPDEDRGETATVLYAEYARDNGIEEFELLMDDRGGKALASDARLTYWDTPTLVLYMVCAGYMTEELGRRVWCQALTSPSARQNYAHRLAGLRKELDAAQAG